LAQKEINSDMIWKYEENPIVVDAVDIYDMLYFEQKSTGVD
jgi:hypothetical protein